MEYRHQPHQSAKAYAGDAPVAMAHDERTVFSFMGRLLPVHTPPWRLGAEYSLCQSLHFELSDFDLRTHTTRIFSRFKLQRTTLSMAADYTFTRRAKERFATTSPSTQASPCSQPTTC